MKETNWLERYDSCRKNFDTCVIPVLSGRGIGEIDSVERTYEITIRIEEEAIDTIDRLWSSHVR